MKRSLEAALPLLLVALLAGCPESPKPPQPTSAATPPPPAATPATPLPPKGPYEDLRVGQTYVEKTNFQGAPEGEVVKTFEVRGITEKFVQVATSETQTATRQTVPKSTLTFKFDQPPPASGPTRTKVGAEKLEVASGSSKIVFDCEVFEIPDPSGVTKKVWISSKFPFVLKVEAAGRVVDEIVSISQPDEKPR